MSQITWKPGLMLSQDPGATLDYVFDFSRYLGEDTISSSSVSGSGCTATQRTADATTVTARVSAVSTPASVTVAIVRASGQIDNRTVHFTPQDH